MIEELIKQFAEKFKNFFFRDLTYFFSGLIIIFFINYSYKIDTINDFIRILGIEDILGIKLFITLLLSYFFGLIIKEGLTFDFKSGNKQKNYWFSTRIFNDYLITEINNDHYKINSYIRFRHDIDELYKTNKRTLDRLERIGYFMHIGASFGLAIFFSIINLIVALFINNLQLNDVWLSLLFLIIVFIMLLFENIWKVSQYKENMIDLGKNL